MQPILFQWRGLTVWSYPAMVYLGLVSGVMAGNVSAHAAGLDGFRTFVATLVLIVLGMAASRLTYVVSHWQIYRNDLRRIWNRNEGGAAHYGGLVVALLASLPLLAVLRLPLGAFWDAQTFVLLPILVFGRIGCLLNGCCGGRPCKGWVSAYLPNRLGEWERRIPTQGLEAAWGVVLLGAAIAAWSWRPYPGGLFLMVAAAYGAGRITLLATRERVADEANRLRVHYAISALMVVLSLAGLTARWWR